ncbi:hypothetical protein H6F86_13875 [Phormidium sp. FACHB-592]|uniref:Uncharacterized protein n=1 Tax=Stenomitos frigidus AS-A4 TaxID=2933935 RepID=A0ABV0KUH5_9CYAN|nr:hypothetical protein [Phormidium sp. FACHB-592]MBD2074962.1 hypothetical protein [Phormidium sp. FACHB-592]
MDEKFPTKRVNSADTRTRTQLLGLPKLTPFSNDPSAYWYAVTAKSLERF